jgi:hypothetical protein
MYFDQTATVLQICTCYLLLLCWTENKTEKKIQIRLIYQYFHIDNG